MEKETDLMKKIKYSSSIAPIALLVLAIAVFSVLQFFSEQILIINFYVTKALFLAGVLIIGTLLVRSVMQEEKRENELEELSEKLKVVNIKLKALDDAKSEFISIAAHQLRTPLSYVKGGVSMLLEKIWGPINDKQKEQMERVYQSNENLIGLINDLLNVAGIESGRINYSFKEAAVEKIVEQAINELQPNAKKKKLFLNFTPLEKSLSQVKVDALKIKQVFLNIIDNAIKYTDKGSVTVNVRQKEDKIIFSCKDTGIGISPEQQKLLFQKFSRAKEVAKAHTEGLGLGLYLAAQLVNAHNGKFWVESEGEGKGSTFYVELPVAK